MVNEQIIKKTVELIKEDLSKRTVPILWLLKGAVAGAGLIFLNGIGKKMYNQFKNPGNYGDRNLLYWGSCYTFATISALFCTVKSACDASRMLCRCSKIALTSS